MGGMTHSTYINKPASCAYFTWAGDVLQGGVHSEYYSEHPLGLRKGITTPVGN